jgi:hypothetical protein
MLWAMGLLAGNGHCWHPANLLSPHFTAGSLQHMDINKNAALQLLYRAALVLVIDGVCQWHYVRVARTVESNMGGCKVDVVHLGSSHWLLVVLLVHAG